MCALCMLHAACAALNGCSRSRPIARDFALKWAANVHAHVLPSCIVSRSRGFTRMYVCVCSRTHVQKRHMHTHKHNGTCVRLMVLRITMRAARRTNTQTTNVNKHTDAHNTQPGASTVNWKQLFCKKIERMCWAVNTTDMRVRCALESMRMREYYLHYPHWHETLNMQAMHKIAHACRLYATPPQQQPEESGRQL